MIVINSKLHLADEEVYFTAARSSGPGGQNVNKVNSQVTLWFDVDHSPSLTAEQKEILHRALPTRINKRGMLWLVCRQYRSQAANRQEALARFVLLLRAALQPTNIRKKTSIPPRAKKERLAEKRRHSQVKRQRAWRRLVDGEE